MWTISTTCTTPVDCTGRVSSDQGWSADVNIHGSEYVVKRDTELGALPERHQSRRASGLPVLARQRKRLGLSRFDDLRRYRQDIW
jgi:hypothetical protein